MRNKFTVHGPTGMELRKCGWFDSEEEAAHVEKWLEWRYRNKFVCISVHSEQEIEDGPDE
jgi:hypothetical protein